MIRNRVALTPLFFVLALGLSGCGRLELLAMVEQRPTTVVSAPGCWTSPDVPRGWHYRSQLDLGERAPSSSQSSRMSAVSRTVRTTAIDPGYSSQSALVLLHILVMLLALVLVPVLALVVVEAFKKKEFTRAAVLGGVTATVGVLAILLGYFSGSVLSLDNTTGAPVRITVDGTPIDVPAQSFTEVRVWGPSVDIQTETGGQLLEQVSIAIDGNPVGTLVRALFGDGRYIYSVCGGNSFSLGHFSYR